MVRIFFGLVRDLIFLKVRKSLFGLFHYPNFRSVFYFGPVLSPIDAEFGIFRKYSLNHGLDRDKEAKVKMYVKIINWAEWVTLD